MNRFMLAVILSMTLIGCTDKEVSPAKTTTGKPATADIQAGKAIAERDCKECHGLNGGGAAPAIPHLAAQRESYLLASLKAYKENKRTHAALRDMMGHMSEADLRNLAAHYASLPPVANVPIKNGQLVFPYERGKALAAACTQCHDEDGNSKIPGIPSLAGQQPLYFVAAIQEYLHAERKTAPMHAKLRRLDKLERESVALYFASQTPAQRAAPSVGDAAAGQPLSAVCGGCHGPQGVSTDAATPSLAGQDARYLADAIKAYRKTRKHEGMRHSIADLSDRDIENIAAFYTVQKSRPAEKGETFIQDLAEKCNRCHKSDADNSAIPVPKINGQDKDYLIMALRAYRDDKRESTTMHRMSLPYSDSVIESIAALYASQPAK
jgi:cytochrome c553